MKLPKPTDIPISRLLILALESAFAFMFWAMQTVNTDYAMSHICLWDRETLLWDSLCSHSSLKEGARGDFELTDE